MWISTDHEVLGPQNYNLMISWFHGYGGRKSFFWYFIKPSSLPHFFFVTTSKTCSYKVNPLFFDLFPAPVRKVTIQQESNTITCRSDGLHPKPQITWSTFPESVVIDQNKTEYHQTEQQLFNIASYLTLSDDVSDFRCVCTVTTPRSSGKYILSIKSKYLFVWM